MEKDWRLFREQDKYLHGVTLIRRAYRPRDPSNDHDHCEFCMAKFGKEAEDLTLGYSTKDRSIWICSQCYDDFKERFEWNVEHT